MTIRDWTEPVPVAEMYGDWDYESAVALLDESLTPRPSRSIFDTVVELGISEGHVILDIGGRDATHGLIMAERTGAQVVVVDPAPANIVDGRAAIAAHDYGPHVDIRPGTIEDIPADDATFDLVFSRDMLGHIEDLDLALAECRRVLKPNGRMLVHRVLATDLLEDEERRYLCLNTATVPDRLSADDFEEAVRRSGLVIEDVEIVGSEWNEASQEAGSVPNYLLQISRLRRARDRYIEALGEMPYRVMYGNALYGAYTLLGKLESRVYVLRASA